MNKLKIERMKVLSRVNKVIKVSHEKLKQSLVDTGVHDHDVSLAKHAKVEDYLGSWSSLMFGVTCLGLFCWCFG